MGHDIGPMTSRRKKDQRDPGGGSDNGNTRGCPDEKRDVGERYCGEFFFSFYKIGLNQYCVSGRPHPNAARDSGDGSAHSPQRVLTGDQSSGSTQCKAY